MAFSVTAVSDQRLALAHRGRGHRMVHDIGAQPLPAISNEELVRVEASKNRLTWVRPRKEVRFFVDLAVELDISSERFEQAGDIVRRKALDAQQRCR